MKEYTTYHFKNLCHPETYKAVLFNLKVTAAYWGTGCLLNKAVNIEEIFLQGALSRAVVCTND